MTDPIVPGRSAAGIELQTRIETILPGHQSQMRSVPYREGVRLWVTDGRIDQIGVSSPYQGRTDMGIGIGSTIREIEAAVGPVFEDDSDNLCVKDSPGWCFETEEWRGHSLQENLDTRVVEIFVFTPVV